jgi:hypothetical protein
MFIDTITFRMGQPRARNGERATVRVLLQRPFHSVSCPQGQKQTRIQCMFEIACLGNASAGESLHLRSHVPELAA